MEQKEGGLAGLESERADSGEKLGVKSSALGDQSHGGRGGARRGRGGPKTKRIGSGVGWEAGWAGPGSSYEAAASHAESLATPAAGSTIQDAAKAVVEGMSHGQAVEVALVGRWGWKDRVDQGSSIPVTAPFLLASQREPPPWADVAQRPSQNCTCRLKQGQDWASSFLTLPGKYPGPACMHSFIPQTLK